MYYTWLYYKQDLDPGIIEQYIYNLPIIADNESEMGYYLEVYDGLKKDIDEMRFTWNNAQMEDLIQNGFKPVDKNDEKILKKKMVDFKLKALNMIFSGSG